MPDIKNYDNNKSDLKGADAEKSSGTLLQFSGIDLSKGKKGEEAVFSSKRAARKKLPIAIDIIVALLFVALFAGVIVGAYFALTSFSRDYESVNVEYTILIPSADESAYSSVASKPLYMEKNGSVEYFGKVKSAKYSVEDGAWLVTVAATVRYKDGEGYSIGQNRLAVGQSLSLRTDSGVAVCGTVVELYDSTRPVSASISLPLIFTKLHAEGGR